MSYIDAEKVKTWEHISKVRFFINQMIEALLKRGQDHDESKLHPPEAEAFAEANSENFLSSVTYGSDEYKEQIRTLLGPALTHHYVQNRHHPEHYENGVDDMSLVDVFEMLADWRAASLRHDDGNILKSIEHNTGRFDLSPQLVQILTNTVNDLGWVSDEERKAAEE